MSLNSIQDVHPDAFQNLSYLQNLNMEVNLLTKPPFLGDICDTLLTLRLNNNSINEIPDGHFKGCTKLRTINLRFNSITQLSNQSLIGLDSLDILQLDNNALTDIECYAFWELSSVTSIGLYNNRLQHYPCYCFENQRDIPIQVRNNPIEKVDAAALKCATNVTELYFSYAHLNNIEFISSIPNLEVLIIELGPVVLAINNMTFSSSFAMRFIAIISCNLNEFPLLNVSKTTATEINLYFNDITCIDVPRITGLVALKALSISKNNLRHFPSTSCPQSKPVNATEASFSFPSLKYIEMYLNKIKVFPVLPGLANEAIVLLYGNGMSQFPMQNMAMLVRVKYLNLKYNLASTFPDFSMLPLTNQLAILYLEYNRIKYIPPAYISSLVRLEQLTLNHNRIKALPEMQFCIPKLWHFPLHSNVLSDLSPMIVQIADKWKIARWNISYNNLTNIPKPLMLQLTNLQHLIASFNIIKEMPYLTAVANKIVYVDLSYNQITVIPAASMKNLRFLTDLDLRGNLVNEFPFWTLVRSASLVNLNLRSNALFTMPRGFPELKLRDTIVIDIRNNPFLCDQRLCWMRHYKPLVLLRDADLCSAPAALVGAVFDELTDTELDCLCKRLWFCFKTLIPRHFIDDISNAFSSTNTLRILIKICS